MPGSLLIGTHKVPRAGFDCLLKPVSRYMEQGKRIIVNLRTCPGPPSLRDRMTADELSDQRRARTAAPDPGAADSTSLGLPVYSFAAYRSDPPVEFDAGYLVDRRGLVFGHAAAAGSDPRLVADRLCGRRRRRHRRRPPPRPAPRPPVRVPDGMGSVNDLILSGPFLGTEQEGGLGPARPSVEPGPRSAMLPEPNLFDSPDGLIHRIGPDPRPSAASSGRPRRFGRPATAITS